MPHARIGQVGPVIAVIFAVLLGLVATEQYAVHKIEGAHAWATAQVAQYVDETMVGSRMPAAGAGGESLTPQVLAESMARASHAFNIRVVGEDARPGKYSFLHRFDYLVHGRRQGRRLSAEDGEDKEAADAWNQGRIEQWVASLPAGHRVARPLGSGRVVVVDGMLTETQRDGWVGPWRLKVLAGSLAAIFFWLFGLRIRQPGPWTGPLLATIAGLIIFALMRLGLDGLTAVVADIVHDLPFVISGQSFSVRPSLGEELLLVVAPLPPLIFAGVVAWRRSSLMSVHRTAFAYVTPAVLGSVLLILIPFAIGVVLAFMRHEHGDFSWVGFDNFKRILLSGEYGLSHPLSFYFTLLVTIGWTAINVVLHVSIGLALALVLRRPTLRFKGLYRVLLIVPWAVPSYITALIWRGMFNKQYGLINQTLEAFGIEGIAWFSHFWTAFMANITTNTWLGFPFMMVVSLGALQSIPRDLYEAAEVDGANGWQQFTRITVPMLKPALAPAIILGAIWTFNMFNVVYLVSGGMPDGSTDILITEAYRWAFEQDRYGFAAAYSLVIFIILVGYSVITNKVTGATKGAFQ